MSDQATRQANEPSDEPGRVWKITGPNSMSSPRRDDHQLSRTIEALDAIAIDDWKKHATELQAEIDRLHDSLRLEADAHAAERTRLRTLLRDVRAPLDDPHLPFVQAALKARQVFQEYDAECAAGKDDNS